MRHFLTALILFALATATLTQTLAFYPVESKSGIVSGAVCTSPGYWLASDGASAGAVFQCVGGLWAIVNDSGSSGTITPAQVNTTVYVNANTTGSDFGAKVNTAIAALPSTGGIVDTTFFHGAQNYTTPIVVSKPNVIIKLGDVFAAYCGTGDAILVTETDGIAPLVRFVAIQGINKWASILTTQSGCGSVADSVVHAKWTTHLFLSDLAISAGTKATRAFWDDQSLDTTMVNVVLASQLTTSGSTPYHASGSGFTHALSVSLSGGEHGMVMEANTTTVPSAVRTALGYVIGDGNVVWYNKYVDLQGLLTYKSAFLIRCNGANLPIEFNEFHGLRSIGAGQDAADADDDSGVYLQCDVPAGTESIQFNKFYGLELIGDYQHGALLHGQVKNNIFDGVNPISNGAVGANAAYGISLKAGTSVFPSYNVITGRLAPSGAVGANKAINIDAGSVFNEIDVYIGASGSTDNSTAGTNSFRYTTNSAVVASYDGTNDFGNAVQLKIPVSAGAAPTVSGTVAYDSTANSLEIGVNGANRKIPAADTNTGIVVYSNATAATHDTGTLSCTAVGMVCVTTYTPAGVNMTCSNDYNVGTPIPFYAVCR